MPRPRPYRSLGSDALVAKLFEVAFNQDAAEVEHVCFEIVGGADGWPGRKHVNHVPHLIQAAKRILELETTPGPPRLSAPELLNLIVKAIEGNVLSCEEVVHQLHCAAYPEHVADALKEINRQVLDLLE